MYCYSFEPAHHWTQYFAQQPELQKYFEGVVEHRQLSPHFRLQTEVLSADYDEAKKHWRVLIRSKDGAEEVIEANSLISAVGQLNLPKLPEVPGIDSFAGQWCHSAQWDESIDYRGKRVVVVGAGASAFQIVPTITAGVSELTVFQRVAPWMFENPIYHEQVPAGMKWCLQHLPFYREWFRFLLFWPACDGAYDTIKVDPEWPHQERSVNEMNDFVYNLFADYIRGQVGDDEELLNKVLPDYPPMGRRTLQDNGSWLGALKQPHVALEKQGIKEVRPEGVVAEDGRLIEADIIIYATGFQVDNFVPMPIRGLGGQVLSEAWGDEPAAYLGVTVAGFPNFYCMFGPGTNLAFGGSLVFNGECQARYIMACIKMLLQSDSEALVCSDDTFNDYQRRFRETHAGLIWEHPGVKTYYRNARGKVTLLWPWKIIDMWRWTQQANAVEYDFS
ncbi:MAG: NAD(P)/FAD-dependent oxidoreductase [Pseudomonadota bacterium]